MESLIEKNILSAFIYWLFFEVPKEILKGWINFLKFGLNFFSIPQLIKTLFSHWRRYKWFYPRGFDFWKYSETLFSNLISRTLGAVLRSILIAAGIVFEGFILVAGLLVLLVWFVLPIFLILAMYHGFRILL